MNLFENITSIRYQRNNAWLFKRPVNIKVVDRILEWSRDVTFRRVSFRGHTLLMLTNEHWVVHTLKVTASHKLLSMLKTRLPSCSD